MSLQSRMLAAGLHSAEEAGANGRKLPSPVAGITADGAGYLLVTKAGNVYPFNTPFYGSKAGHKLPTPVVGITAAR